MENEVLKIIFSLGFGEEGLDWELDTEDQGESASLDKKDL